MNTNSFSFFADVEKAVLFNLRAISRGDASTSYLNQVVKALYSANGQGYNYLRPLRIENLFSTVVSKIETISRYSDNVGWVHESKFVMTVTVDGDKGNRSAGTSFILGKQDFDNTWMFNRVLVAQNKTRQFFEENGLKSNPYFFDEMIDNNLRDENEKTDFSLFGQVEYTNTKLTGVTTTLVPKPKITDALTELRKLADE